MSNNEDEKQRGQEPAFASSTEIRRKMDWLADDLFAADWPSDDVFAAEDCKRLVRFSFDLPLISWEQNYRLSDNERELLERLEQENQSPPMQRDVDVFFQNLFSRSRGTILLILRNYWKLFSIQKNAVR